MLRTIGLALSRILARVQAAFHRIIQKSRLIHTNVAFLSHTSGCGRMGHRRQGQAPRSRRFPGMNTMKTLFATVASAGLLTVAASAQTTAIAEPVTGTTAAQTTTTLTNETDNAKATGPDVGISSRDGISLSGTAVLVTRNGVTETLQKEISLVNGTRVAPNGTVTPQAGGSFALRSTQILSFEGTLMNTADSSKAPVVSGTSATGPAATGAEAQVRTTTSTTATGTSAPLVPDPAGTAAAAAEAERRSNAAKSTLPTTPAVEVQQ